MDAKPAAPPGPPADGADPPTGSDTFEIEDGETTDDDQAGSGTEGASGVDDRTDFMTTVEVTDQVMARRLQGEFNVRAGNHQLHVNPMIVGSSEGEEGG